MRTEVLRAADPAEAKRWLKLICETAGADIYFTPQYARIYESKGEGEALCFVIQDEACGRVLYPFLKRRVNDLTEFSGLQESLFDTVSPYGYGGPLLHPATASEEKLNTMAGTFRVAFHEYCLRERIVAEFARLHPLLRNHEALKGHVSVTERNKTVFIDLTGGREGIWKGIRKGHRSGIRSGEKNGVVIERDDRFESLEEFVRLYTLTMERNKASAYHFFPSKFFRDTTDLLHGHLYLYRALYDGKVVAASLFMHFGDYLHYHFSGMDAAYSSVCANHLLLFRVALEASERGFRFFHLGGGVAGPEDSLYHFKGGFSRNRSLFSTYEQIHDPERYTLLCNLKKGNLTGEEIEKWENNRYFPRYRA